MKTFLSTIIALLMVGMASGQFLTDNLNISGYVTDQNGNAVAGAQVCAFSDSTASFVYFDCTNTNANGWYQFDIVGGSVSGPNIDFYVYLNDSCGPNWLPPPPTVISNMQGTVDFATANFVSCANSTGGGNCGVTITQTQSVFDSTLFTFTATPIGTAPFTYMWQPNGATTQTTSINFSNPDVACVTVTDANGCVATACDTVWPGGCYADFWLGANNPGGVISAMDTVQAYFTGSSQPGNTYTWTVTGAGMTTTYSGQNPWMYFPSAGSYTVCVTVDDGNGCTDTSCQTITVVGANNCTASIATSIDSVNQATVLTAIPMGGTGPYAYLWANGATTQSITPNATGVYCVTITDVNGCSATVCESYTGGGTGNCSGTITSTVDTTGGGLVYTVTANPTGTAPFTYAWWSGETTQTITFQPNPIWGDTVCVTITDATGCVTDICEALTSVGNSCYASFYSYIDSTCMLPLDCYQFVDQSAGLNTQAVSWFWDLGDGNTSTDQNPMHAYSNPGTYTVCLTVTMSDGCVNTYCDYITVGGGNGNCDGTFTYSGPTPIGYTFSANSQQANLTYEWTLDGVVVGNGMDYFAPGFAPGTYTICLTVSDSANCFDTSCQTITIGNGACEGYISGFVGAGSLNQPLDNGTVWLITFDPLTNLLTAVDSMSIDSGYFFFGPVPCGDYLIKAAAGPNSAYYSDHIPTYYGNSPFWDFAQTVSISQANIQVITDILLISGNNPGGPGFIGGDVTQGANKWGDIGDPVVGATVLLFDMAGNNISYQYTDINGEFGFSNLAWGTYQVYVEMLNKETVPAIVTIGPANPSVENVHVQVFETEITTGIEDQPVVLEDMGMYPNPTSGVTTVDLSSEISTQLSMSIVEMTGRVVMTQTYQLNPGSNRVQFNADQLSEGYYNLTFTNVESTVQINQKLIVVD